MKVIHARQSCDKRALAKRFLLSKRKVCAASASCADLPPLHHQMLYEFCDTSIVESIHERKICQKLSSSMAGTFEISRSVSAKEEDHAGAARSYRG